MEPLIEINDDKRPDCFETFVYPGWFSSAFSVLKQLQENRGEDLVTVEFYTDTGILSVLFLEPAESTDEFNAYYTEFNEEDMENFLEIAKGTWKSCYANAKPDRFFGVILFILKLMGHKKEKNKK